MEGVFGFVRFTPGDIRARRAYLGAMKNLTVGLFLVGVAVSAAGCGDQAADGVASGTAAASGKPAKSAAAATSGTAAASASAAPTASAAASAAAGGDDFASFKDTDLSAFHKLWKGFSIKAPEGATISQGYGGPKIEKGKEFSIQLSYSDTSLDNTADSTKECVNYDQKCAVVERTKDLVVTSASDKDGKNTSYGFHMLIRPGGSLMGCKGGGPDLAKVEVLKKVCQSVEKK